MTNYPSFPAPDERFERLNEVLQRSGQGPWTREEFDRYEREREEMMAHSMNKISVGLELTDGRYIPDGAGGVVENDGRWQRQSDGNWKVDPGF